MSQQKRCYEDFEPGQAFPLAPFTVSREDILDYASEYDPQPFHLDDEAAKASLLGGLAASGWHTGAIGMRMVYDSFLQETHSMGSPGVEEGNWYRPVRPGDVLTGSLHVLEMRQLRSKPGVGMVKMQLDLHNQDKLQVFRWISPLLVRTRESLA